MNLKEKTFVKNVQDFYRKNGRHDLPWRKTYDPYKILVSEIMLQQTQVDRVIPKYQAFLKAFPRVEVLAKASLPQVLRLWSGLGYNRRAKFLHQCAKVCVKDFGSAFPKDPTVLKTLPGIGPYTSVAVCIFAFNMRAVCVETNVRTVIIHHFFKHKKNISEEAIKEIVANTLPKKDPRIWYAALMDYGTYLKSQGIKTHQQSKVYKKQRVFKGSPRALRGQIIRDLLEKKRTRTWFMKTYTDDRLLSVLLVLEKEGLIKRVDNLYLLGES